MDTESNCTQSRRPCQTRPPQRGSSPRSPQPHGRRRPRTLCCRSHRYGHKLALASYMHPQDRKHQSVSHRCITNDEARVTLRSALCTTIVPLKTKTAVSECCCILLSSVTYLAMAHVSQGFPRLLQVAQTGVDLAVGIAGRLHAVLITGCWPVNTLILWAV